MGQIRRMLSPYFYLWASVFVFVGGVILSAPFLAIAHWYAGRKIEWWLWSLLALFAFSLITFLVFLRLPKDRRRRIVYPRNFRDYIDRLEQEKGGFQQPPANFLKPHRLSNRAEADSWRVMLPYLASFIVPTALLGAFVTDTKNPWIIAGFTANFAIWIAVGYRVQRKIKDVRKRDCEPSNDPPLAGSQSK